MAVAEDTAVARGRATAKQSATAKQQRLQHDSHGGEFRTTVSLQCRTGSVSIRYRTSTSMNAPIRMNAPTTDASATTASTPNFACFDGVSIDDLNLGPARCFRSRMPAESLRSFAIFTAVSLVAHDRSATSSARYQTPSTHRRSPAHHCARRPFAASKTVVRPRMSNSVLCLPRPSRSTAKRIWDHFDRFDAQPNPCSNTLLSTACE